MKYLIFSDLHGSISSLIKVIEAFNDEHCDLMICLGDVLYHGPRNEIPDNYNPKEVVKLLNEYNKKIIWIKGNCDAEVDDMVLNTKMRKAYRLKNIYFCHGHHLKIKSKIFKKIIFYGHTHVMCYKKIGNTYYINPGSVTIPKSDKKSFIIMNDNSIYFYDLDMNLINKEILK